MKPTTISEQLMFSTVRLETSSGSGTGFFYYFVYDDKTVPILITNKHVVNFKTNETVTFYLHLHDGNNESIDNYKVKLSIDWFFHSSKDLCFCFVNQLFEEVKRCTGKEVFVIPVTDNIAATPDKLSELCAIEELVMVGYPIGLWDQKNNFPIFRRGYTASHPALDFNEPGIGLVDMACFPGSSGSPIFILNENGYTDKKGCTHLGAQRIILLGILFAGPTYNANGNLVVTSIPTTHQQVSPITPIMTNLGYYIKTSELQEFRQYIGSMLEG